MMEVPSVNAVGDCLTDTPLSVDNRNNELFLQKADLRRKRFCPRRLRCPDILCQDSVGRDARRLVVSQQMKDTNLTAAYYCNCVSTFVRCRCESNPQILAWGSIALSVPKIHPGHRQNMTEGIESARFVLWTSCMKVQLARSELSWMITQPPFLWSDFR